LQVGPLRSTTSTQPALQQQPHQQQQTTQSKTLTQERLNQVQRMIEECLRVYMSADDICEALRVQQGVDAAHTRAIYNSLKSASPEFFEVYELRLRVKEQIAAFNFVVAQQVVAAQEMKLQVKLEQQK
jgi:uncharacterized protein (TIGR01589 family)